MSFPRIVKRPAHAAAILVFPAFAAGLLFFSGVTNYWDTGLYDLCIKARVLYGNETQSRLVAPIDINDVSIEALSEQLDTREAFTNVLDVLSQSNSSVALDFLFRYAKKDDGAFIDSIYNSKDSVLAAAAVEEQIAELNPLYRELTEAERRMLRMHTWHINVIKKGKIPRAATFLLPFPELGEAGKQVAHINMDPDPDGVYRRVHLLYEWEDGFLPSMPLAAAVLYYGVPAESIILKAGSYLAIPFSEEEIIRIPIDEYGRMFIPYTESWKDDKKRIPFHVIAGAKNDAVLFDTVFSSLNNRIAFISEINANQKDFGSTSFERLYPLSGVHIEVLSGILNGFEKRAFIGITSPVFKLITILLFIVIAFIINKKVKKDLNFHFCHLTVLLLFSVLTFIRWQYAAVFPWYSLPVVLMIFLWTGAFLARLNVHRREQLLLRNALSRYFPHALAERIMRERKTDFIPAYKELTILFSDISGFTKWSSDKNPEHVHGFLNEYLECMADIIFTHGGTVDKFMGDGIIAFFGDPFEMHNHSEQCLKAAAAMQEKIRLLAEKWKSASDIDLKVRIGVNTGKVIVGNLGSKTRIEYTVIGSDVNLAQRMESNAPPGGILVTAAVWEKVRGKFTFSGKQFVTVKGYSEPIEAYLLEV